MEGTLATPNASLPNITLFATGGTIAGQGTSSTKNDHYAVSASTSDLLAAVPEVLTHANIAHHALTAVVSENITQTILLQLHKAIAAELLKPDVAGVVLTHGTNTLEETAFFLELTLRTSKPVVCTAAMRPATAISADGPANLLQSVVLATAASARDRGVLVAMNDKIASAAYTLKTHANNPASFSHSDAGTLGYFLDHKPFFHFTPARAVGLPHFDIAATESLPQIDILYAHQDMNPALVHASVASGARGIVFAGNGDGGIARAVFEAARAVHEEFGTSVVRSHKVPYGWASSEDFAIGSAHLNPNKARILLQLAVHAGMDDSEIRAVFDALRPSPWT
ncbi:hypothetical protein LTR53_013225 [Teratosphaeriaceae sp. CCFEE 6253]|nr:hypothetical protein LTR53_013225 [Teratosphaeriaceae sp. CCFEE 6253]